MSLTPNQSWQFAAILKEKDGESRCMDVASKSHCDDFVEIWANPCKRTVSTDDVACKNGGRKVGHACARLNSDGGSRKALVSGLCQ